MVVSKYNLESGEESVHVYYVTFLCSLPIAVKENGGAYSSVQAAQRPDIQHSEQAHVQQ